MEDELKEVLKSEYVIECVKDILKDIKEGKKAFSSTDMAIPLGFGEGCFYETKRKMLKDMIYTFFNDGFDDAVRLFFKEIKEMVKGEADDAIWNIHELIDRLDGTEVKIVVDLDRWASHKEKDMQIFLDRMEDGEIEEYFKGLENEKE